MSNNNNIFNRYQAALYEAALYEEVKHGVRMHSAEPFEVQRLLTAAQKGCPMARRALLTTLDWWAVYFAYGQEYANEIKREERGNAEHTVLH